MSGVAIAAITPKPSSAAEPSAPAATPQPPPVAAPKSPAPAPNSTTGGARTLGLAPEDWLFATWRQRSTVPVPPAPAFDAERVSAALRRVKIGGYGWSADWSAVPFPPAMTTTEAAHWLGVLAGMKKDVDVQRLGEEVLSSRPGTPSLSTLHELIFNDGHRWFGPELMIAIRALLSTDEIVSMVLDAPQPRHQSASSYINGFRRYVLPYMTDAELASARERMSSAVQATKWVADLYHAPREFHLAALLGMHEPLRRTVESWPDNAYTTTSGGWKGHYHAPQLIVFGLEDAAMVEHHWRRLRLPHKLPRHIRGWLAHTELSALDVVRDSIIASANREQAEALVEVLAGVVAPEVAPTMLELSSRSRAPKPARTWLEEHPAEATAGLAPTAATRGALADAAIETLRSLSRRGHTAAVAEAIARLEPGAKARVRAAVLEAAEDQLAELDDGTTPAWLKTALATVPTGKKAKTPTWVGPEHLPALVVGDKRLGASHVSSVLVALAASPLGEPQPLVKAIAEHVDARYRHAFAWRLLERWRSEGAPPKEKWAMCALGHLGTDESVLALAPLVRAWPGESQHQRAVLGLEVLRAIGSDAALMQLNAIAQNLKFQGLKARAKALMEQIAEQKGLTRAEPSRADA